MEDRNMHLQQENERLIRKYAELMDILKVVFCGTVPTEADEQREWNKFLERNNLKSQFNNQL